MCMVHNGKSAQGQLDTWLSGILCSYSNCNCICFTPEHMPHKHYRRTTIGCGRAGGSVIFTIADCVQGASQVCLALACGCLASGQNAPSTNSYKSLDESILISFDDSSASAACYFR